MCGSLSKTVCEDPILDSVKQYEFKVRSENELLHAGQSAKVIGTERVEDCLLPSCKRLLHSSDQPGNHPAS